ncbi:MAG: hypothetical protein QOE84_2511 [Actinomycetota bacterium]|jgi:hypothetical protein|nr:hypothetical protein [Actinomycetota bacterium]
MNGLSRPVGSACAVLGGVVALVGNLLAPRFDQNDNVAVYRAVAASGRLAPSGLVLVLAFALTTIGILAIASSLRGGRGNDAAWLGAAAVAAGGAIALAQNSLEMFGYRQMARVFAGANAQNQQGAFWATSALDKANSSLFSTWTLLLLGLAPLLISVAMLQTRAFPAWLAGLGVVGGVICSFVGVANLLMEDQAALNLVFLVGSLLVTAWLIAAGVLMRREPIAAA